MSHPNFCICEDGAYKILELFHKTMVIQNTRENGKVIIDLSSITDISPDINSKTGVSLKYTSNGSTTTQNFSCDDRLNLLSDIITMKDRSSKIISDYSIETFKCYLMTNMDDIKKIILKKIGKILSENAKLDSKNMAINSPTFKVSDYKVYCTLYRTYMSSSQLTNKELKTYYKDLSQIIKIKIAEDIYALILQNKNKIEIAIVPVNKNDLITIKNLIISYAEKYLCYQIPYIDKDDYLKDNLPSPNNIYPSLKLTKANSSQIKEKEYKNMEKLISKSKMQNIINNNEITLIKNEINIAKNKSGKSPIKKKKSLFKDDSIKEFKAKMREQDKKDYLFIHHNVNRILYNENKLNLILKSNSEYINLFSVGGEKIAQIKINDIFGIIINGVKDSFFEIVLEDKSRYILEVEKKNDVLNDIMELLLKYRKNDEKFLILSYKINLKRKHKWHQEEGKKVFEDYLIEQIKSDLFQKENLIVNLEEIIMNFFLIEGPSKKIQDLLLDDSLIENLVESLEYHYNEIINIINDKEKDDYKKKVSIQNNVKKLNLLLIFFKNLGTYLLFNLNGRKIYDKLFDLLSNELKDRHYQNNKNYQIILNDYALFYNTIHILEDFPLYKQMMLIKILSFDRDNTIINADQEIDLDSVFINTLLIIYENKLKEIDKFEDDFIQESSYYYYLFILYKVFLNESPCTLRNGISLLTSILEKLGEKKQREMKEVLLKKTLILFILIKIFILNNNNDVIITKNCLKFFQILFPQYYEMTIPLKNLFPNTLIQIFGNQKEPDKWDKIQIDKFFVSILKDYSEEKIIWNSECKKELINALTNLIDDYEKSIKKKISLNTDINNYNNDKIYEDGFTDLIKIIFNTENDNNHIPDDILKKKYIDSKSFFNIDYKNIKVNYKTLKKEIYILDTYISQLIKDNKKEINIQMPHKFWKKLKHKLIKNNEEKRISILKVMILFYKKYYLTIGEFDYYNIANRIYKSTSNDKIRSLVTELINTTISIDDDEIKQNNINELNKENINFNINHKLK